MLLVNLTGKQNTRTCNSQERHQLTSSSQQEDSSQLTEKLGQLEWQHVHWYTSPQDHQPPTLLWPAHWNELGTSQALPLSTAVSPHITQEKNQYLVSGEIILDREQQTSTLPLCYLESHQHGWRKARPSCSQQCGHPGYTCGGFQHSNSCPLCWNLQTSSHYVECPDLHPKHPVSK